MNEFESQACLHCTVTGRVQGVGFRAFTVNRARALGLVGWVRNLEDGRSVEVWAEGSESCLNHLREGLESGPRESRVDQLSCSACDPTGAYLGFDVRW